MLPYSKYSEQVPGVGSAVTHGGRQSYLRAGICCWQFGLFVPAIPTVCFSTRYNRWPSEFREYLFSILYYLDVSALVGEFRVPKLPDIIAISILHKCSALARSYTLVRSVSRGAYRPYYFRAVLYWFKVLVEPPIMKEDGVQTPTGEMKTLTFGTKKERDAALCVMASNLFALHYVIWSSCQVVNSPDLMFPVSIPGLTQASGGDLSTLARRLIDDVLKRSKVQTRQYSARGRTFTMKKQYFFFKNSKPLINEIDHLLAGYYGFSEEELDFIVNYDIKYRMGRDAESEDDEASEPLTVKLGDAHWPRRLTARLGRSRHRR